MKEAEYVTTLAFYKHNSHPTGPKAALTAARHRCRKDTQLKCVKCGRLNGFGADRMTVDHIVPKSKGGSDSYKNLQFMCYGCNYTKGNSNPL